MVKNEGEHPYEFDKYGSMCAVQLVDHTQVQPIESASAAMLAELGEGEVELVSLYKEHCAGERADGEQSFTAGEWRQQARQATREGTCRSQKGGGTQTR